MRIDGIDGWYRRRAACGVLAGMVGAFALALIVWPERARAHEARHPVAGLKIDIKTSSGPAKAKFKFQFKKQFAFDVNAHDPRTDGLSILVMGEGSFAGRTELIVLDPSLWRVTGSEANVKGYRYTDNSASRGGIRKVSLKDGQIKIQGQGPNWSWDPAGSQDAVNVYVSVEDEIFCARFGGVIQKNEAGRFRARAALSPGACPDQVCGNSIVETGEQCDDGNLADDDGCNSECTVGTCSGQQFASTYEAIQAIVFDGAGVYGCASALCHDALGPQGNLSLDAADSYANLVNVPSPNHPIKLVEPGEPAESLLYLKLAAATLGDPLTYGSPMPSGGAPALTEDHLEAIEKWIRGGAPEDLVVEGTAELLASCLPDPDPLKIPPLDPPGQDVGVQVRSTAWELNAESEDEVCFATYYDLTQTNLVPSWAKVTCPPPFDNAPNNPSNECFLYHRTVLAQDPQSHHSIIHYYTGDFDVSHAGWGAWTYKMNDLNDPQNGQPCDPTVVDPATGYHDGCSGSVQSAIACIGFGPPDYSQGGFGGGGSTAPSIGGSQEPYFEVLLANGVYDVLPMAGVITWNSHAFNLTSTDTTMAQYLNLDFAQAADQLYPAKPIFDSSQIFVQNVPPFETREYCKTYTLPEGASLFYLSSHTHRHGVLFRIWGPPNNPCGPTTCTPGNPANTIYQSTEYNDPLQLYYEPPVPHGTGTSAQAVRDRSYLFCSVYDNGATPTSPAVKRQSTSPDPPLIFGLPIGPGGPCDDSEVACANDGPQKGQLCNGSDAVCDSTPGANDGDCDACPLRGGVTTEDEMFILIGGYFVP